jgi:hypothetical protein
MSKFCVLTIVVAILLVIPVGEVKKPLKRIVWRCFGYLTLSESCDTFLYMRTFSLYLRTVLCFDAWWLFICLF